MPPQIRPTNKVFINMTALRHNLREVRELAGDRHIMAVVKADAYGHGLLGSALTFTQAGADALGVMEIDDALTLREHGLNLPIHILGGLNDPDQLEAALRQDLSFFASGPEQIRALSAKGANLGLRAKLHIKIDTGLGRRGIPADEAEGFLREVAQWPSLQIQGLATHLATAGDPGAAAQLDIFAKICYKAKAIGIKGECHSALASSGLIWHQNDPSKLLRVGLMLYGVHPGPEIGPVRPDLRPAMTVLSRVTHLRELEPGDTVGYNRTFVCRKPMRLAVLPFGYAQGLIRSRSGRGWVLIRGRRAPQVGLISMNSSTYDVTSIPDVALGDNAVILGRHSTSQVRAGDLAAWGSTTPYEMLNLLGRLNTRYIEGSDYEDSVEC